MPLGLYWVRGGGRLYGDFGFVLAFVVDRVLLHPLALVRTEHLRRHFLAVRGHDLAVAGERVVLQILMRVEVEEHVLRTALFVEILTFGLDRDVAVTRHPRTGRDQFPDDDVFLEAESGSCLPLIAASVRTRVVSWNDAAERNDSVASEAFVTPSSTGAAFGLLLPSFGQPRRWLRRTPTLRSS